MQRIGLISDTHRLLRPQAKEFLRGCAHIIHGGDIGDKSVLEELALIAPITAVRGNNDRGAWADALAESELLRFEECCIYAVHDIATLDIDPAAAGVKVVVFGHSHKPEIYERNGVLYVNPGSAGPRRFKLPVSVGELVVNGADVKARWMELQIAS